MDKKEIVNGMISLNELSSQLSQNKDLAMQYLDIYRMNAQCKAEIRKLELQNDFMIKQMTQRYQMCRFALSKIFDERDKALNVHYETLEKALQTDDRELIITSLRGISSIVEKNPLESFKEFTKALDNKDETLYLDF